MSLTAVIGAQWGDEGKGKIVDALSESADLVARFQGGANAGHTIQIGNEETILHQIPSGILRPQTHCLLGNGMAFDPVGLQKEIGEIARKGIDVTGRLHISPLAHVVTPLHKILDAYQEQTSGAKAIGTTKRGIGPCYSDKIGRTGIRVRDLTESAALSANIAAKTAVLRQIVNLTEAEEQQLDQDLETFFTAVDFIQPFIDNTIFRIHAYLEKGQNVLAEGAQGVMLDIDFGSYPFVTASNTTSGNIATGLGIGPKQIDKIIGVFKSYTTRVGAGPFPTELEDTIGDHLQSRGNEFGATTRRRRRCGWFDAALGKYSVMINGFTSIALTKLDVLDEMAEIKICTHYENGEFPFLNLKDVHPVYRTMSGWQRSTANARSLADLPKAARRYLDTLEELLAVKIALVSVGKERSQIISL
jgi:adenylosuccinate synthase